MPGDPQRPGAIALACGLAEASAQWVDNLIAVEYPLTWQNGTPPADHQGPPRITQSGTYPNLTKTVEYFVVDMGVTQYHRFYEMSSGGSATNYGYQATFYSWGWESGQWHQSIARHQRAGITETNSYIEGYDGEGHAWSGNGALAGVNSWDDLNRDLDQMLATWDMTDDELFPWMSCCGDAVLLTRKEGERAVPSPYNAAGSYTNDPIPYWFGRSSFAEGEIIGKPVTGPGPYLDPDGGESRFPHAIQWLGGWAGLWTEPGGLIQYNPGFWSDTVLKVKWAMQKYDHVPYSGGNPTGDFVFVSGTAVPLSAQQGRASSTPCSYGVMAVSPNDEHFAAGETFPLLAPPPRSDLVWFALCYSTMADAQGNYVEARAQQPPGFNFAWPLPAIEHPCLQGDAYYPPE